MTKAQINGETAPAQQINGGAAIPQVSRETIEIMQRILNNVTGNAEQLCRSARLLTDEVLLPVTILVRVMPDAQAAVVGHNLGEMLIGAPPVIQNNELRAIFELAIRAMQRQDGAPQPEPVLGNEGDALAAMQQAMEEPISPPFAKPPEMDIPGDDA